MMFTLTFLGTSAGMPTRQRNVSALAVQAASGPGWLLVDCGEGTQHQLLRSQLALRDLAAVCITHAHGDHCYGLPGLLESAGMVGRTAPLPLIAPAPVWQWLQTTQALTDSQLPYEVQHVNADTWHWQGPSTALRIERHALLHRVPSHAFRIELTQTQARLNTQALRAAGLPPGPAWHALREGRDAPFESAAGGLLRSADFTEQQTLRACAVIGGDNADPTLLRAACAGAQLLVHEATFTQAILDKTGCNKWMHSSAQMTAAFAESAGVPNLILTHLSTRHHKPEELTALHQEAAAQYHGALWIANDLDVFTLNQQGQVALH